MCRVTDHIWNEFENTVKRKTRRRRQCDECGKWIAPGETYFHFSCKTSEGWFDSSDFCRWCKKRTEWLSKECNGYLLTEVVEDFEEHFQSKEESILWILKELGEAV